VRRMPHLLAVPVAAWLSLTGCPVAVTDTYTLEPESQGGASGACADGRVTGDETDVDCGGTECDPCVSGRSCVEATDCESGVCTTDVCE